jgi:hypothetical protein
VALASPAVANHKKTAKPRTPQHHLPKVGTPADNAYRQKRGRQDVVDFGANRGRGGSRWAMIIGVLIVAALVIGVVGLIILT